MVGGVTVVAHNYMPVEMDNWPAKFDVVIIDEKFYSTMIRERRLKLNKIAPARITFKGIRSSPTIAR